MNSDVKEEVDKLIDDYLHSEERRDRKVGQYYPSEIWMCMRKLYYMYTQPIKEFSREKTRVFAVGIMFHDFMQKVFEAADGKGIKLLANERSLALGDFDSDIVLRARLDNLIVIEKDGGPRIVEVKSIASRGFDYLSGPKEEHIIQIMPYMKVMGIHEGIIIYLDKEKLRQKTYEIKYDDNIVKLIRNRARMLDEFLKHKEMPRPEAKIERVLTWQCNYCEYKDDCDKQP